MPHSTASLDDVNTVNEITSSVERRLQDLQGMSDECCIYEVPHRIRKVNEQAFTPQVIAIGPLHHGKEELSAMEYHKTKYLQHFLQLTEDNVSLKEYIEFIRDRETRLRSCYADVIRFHSKQLIELVLTDAAFVILFLLKFSVGIQFVGDRVFNKPLKLYEIREDIMLLENQLPFFILEELFEFSKISEDLQRSVVFPDTSVLRDGVDLIKLSYLFFDAQIQLPGKLTNKNYIFKAEHLLHFLRIQYIPLGYHRQREETELNMPSAMELHHAGVKIKAKSGKNLFEIQFRDGILEIPPLEIQDTTETLFQNLCAYEQSHYCTSFFVNINHSTSENEECGCVNGLFSDYISFMCQLVKDVKDAELLVQEDVIQNRVGSFDRVLSFFHNLDTGKLVDTGHYCYGTVVQDLRKYYAEPWNKRKAILKQEYFNNPWSGISVFAASILLLLTIIQTVCSILQV